MKAVVQRVSSASLSVDGKIISEIEKGFVVYFGVAEGDGLDKADFIAKKISGLRVFEDENEKMNLSIKDINGELLIISQFTLYADCSGGNRPSFVNAAKPEKANELYEYFIKKCKEQNIKVEHGIFGADMKVELLNDGPVTIILEK